MSNNLPFSEQDSRYFIGYKDNKKLDLHAYHFQKWIHIEVLIEIIVCISW